MPSTIRKEKRIYHIYQQYKVNTNNIQNNMYIKHSYSNILATIKYIKAYKCYLKKKLNIFFWFKRYGKNPNSWSHYKKIYFDRS